MWIPKDEAQFWADHEAGMHRKVLAEKYSGTFEQVKHFLSMKNARLAIPPAPASDDGPESIVVSSGMTADGTRNETRLVDHDVRSLDELIELYQVDTTQWEVIDFKCSTGSWDGFWKDSDNEAQTKTLYRYRCDARFRPVKKTIRDMFADVKEQLAEIKLYAPEYPTIKRSKVPAYSEHCLEIDIPDLHMGKLAWGAETGYHNYDVNIAESLFFEAIESALRWAKMFDIGQIMLPLGNDLLNCDSSDNTTTAGTPQSADGRQKKTYLRTRKMILTGLEMCREVAPVLGIVIPGNHDSDTMFYLGDSLQGWTHRCDDIEIDNRACHMKTFQWGANGIMLTHGEEKEADLALTFADTFPDLWAGTSYREVQCGHIHTTKVRDYRGCQVRYVGSLTGTDYWHARHNYKSRRTAMFFVWQKDGRESYIKNFNAPEDRILRAQG